MLRATFEDKAENHRATQPWELTGKEIVQLEEARADLAMKKGAYKRALKKAPKGAAANHDAELLAARDNLRFARLRLEEIKQQLRAAVRRRLTPPELLEDD